ncbi:MAG: 2-amino-4-hydroxy-6-hydroxymethyldihydropteridine diphosphokinase [Alphaproteobacteria bacterium]|nr:2-amino-4-hydroxy-6-hydroxymethyldihydropteridine diphosphokinase [Alphaproteobacteria bacterium]
MASDFSILPNFPILIGVGANLPHPHYGAAQNTCELALTALQKYNIKIAAQSSWYKTAPVPLSDQPWYINGVCLIDYRDTYDPIVLLNILHTVEEKFGRTRHVKNEPRYLDLDLLTFGCFIVEHQNVVIPHPRLHERAFVLHPLKEIMPDWFHPVSKKTIDEFLQNLPPDQQCDPI